MLALVSLSIALVADRTGGSDTGATAIEQPDDADRFADRYVQPDALPTIYTGELVDIDVDGQPDFALFGDPEAPVVRPLVEANDRPWLVPTITAIGAIIVVIISSVTRVYVARRGSGDDGD